MEFVSGWDDGRSVFFALRTFDGRRLIKRSRADWDFFVWGMRDHELQTLGRLPEVVAVHSDGPNRKRIKCRSFFDRRRVVDRLEKAQKAGVDHFKILEADVRPVLRYLSDHSDVNVSENPRVAYIDLETDSRSSISGAVDGNARLLSWAVVDAEGNASSGLLDEDSDRSERELWKGFIKAINPFDCVVAWNGDFFDFPVIFNRCERLGINPKWDYWTWLDHLLIYKKYNMTDGGGEEKESFALDHVANVLLGEGKHDFDAAKTWEAWSEGGHERERLLKYNVQDTALLPRIEDKTGLISLHFAVCHITRVFPNSRSLSATAQGDGFMLQLGADHGHRWATKKHIEDAPKFEGALVIHPSRLGIIDNVHVCDFSGLYPSIMRTWNMSPDTKTRPRREPSDSSVPCIEEGICQIPERLTWFRNDTDGMFRIALDRLVAKRAEYQSEMKRCTPGTPEHARAKRLQAAFKVVANSFYGIVGSMYSRFYDPEIAEGVTKTGQWLIRNVIKEAENRGLDPFYGDTDSVFISGDVEDMTNLVRHMNQTWSSRVRPWGILDGHPMHIDLDFEKTFSRIIMVSAKRYAGRFLVYKGKAATVDAKPEVKGLEFKRGDQIHLARQMQYQIVSEILCVGEEHGDPPGLEYVIDYVEKWRKKILIDPIDLEHMRLSKSLSKPVSAYKDPLPQHVKVAIQIQEDQNIEMVDGDRVPYYVGRGPDGKTYGFPIYVEDPEEKIDREYYWDRIYKPTQRILELCYPEYQWKESKKDTRMRKQRNLFDTRRKPVITYSATTREQITASRALAKLYPGGTMIQIRIGDELVRLGSVEHKALSEKLLEIGLDRSER